MKSKLLSMLILLFGLSAILTVYAQDEGQQEEEVAAEEQAESDQAQPGEEDKEATGPLPAIYLPLKPAFVVNYGGKGRLRYLKTEMSVRLASTDAANSVRHHMPYIRNNLVMLFARQTEETMSSLEGRELMRQDALMEIREILKEEDAQDGVLDVYFNSFIVQN